MSSSPGTVGSLEETLRAILPEGKFGAELPPVHEWNPADEQDIGMEIRADGTWWHEGGQIRRERLVRLFARILRRDPDGRIFLVTPVEKVLVHVEDAPFIAARVDLAGNPGEGQSIVFTTTLGETTIAGPDRPIRVRSDPQTGLITPYVLVRTGLEARLSRPVYYELAGLAGPSPERADIMGVWSQGVFFPVGYLEQAGHVLD